MRLGVSDELCERVDRQALADHDHVRRLHRERDWLEALDGVPAEVGKQRGVGDVRARVGEQQSMPVRCCARYVGCRQIAIRSGAVLDDDRLRSEEQPSELQSLMRISYAVL